MLVVLKLESRTVLFNSFRFECLNKGLSPFHWLSFKKFSSQDAEGKTLTWRVRWSVFLSWNLFPIFTWEKAAKQLCVCVCVGDLKMPSLSFHFLKKAAVALAAPKLAISSCICPPFPCKVFFEGRLQHTLPVFIAAKTKFHVQHWDGVEMLQLGAWQARFLSQALVVPC